jgi:hypothetical protein
MFKDPVSTMRIYWFLTLFLALALAAPSIWSAHWYEAVAKFIFLTSLALLGLKFYLFRNGYKEKAEE